MQGSVAAELGLNPMGPCSLPSSPALKTRGNEAGNVSLLSPLYSHVAFIIFFSSCYH